MRSALRRGYPPPWMPTRSVAARLATQIDQLKAAFAHLAYIFQGAIGDWRGDDPQTLSQWILLLGSSFAMLIIVTFYTAQVWRGTRFL